MRQQQHHSGERRPSSRVPGRRRGFTLIEVLVVVVVLATLMSVALPLYLGAVADSERSVCRANMQTIANAEQSHRVHHPTHVFTTILTNLHPDLNAIPICPLGGSYSVVIASGTETANNGHLVPAGGIIVHCSEPTHGVYAPSIDSD